MFARISAALLMVATALHVPAACAEALPIPDGNMPQGLRTSPLGQNLEDVQDWSTSYNFVDVMKQARPTDPEGCPSPWMFGRTGRHISSIELRARTFFASSLIPGAPTRNLRYFAMSVRGALSPPLDTVIPVSKSSPLAMSWPFVTV